MAEQRTSADLVQDLWRRRPHARAFPGGQDNGKTGAREIRP
jgi:hypothetical protein